MPRLRRRSSELAISGVDADAAKRLEMASGIGVPARSGISFARSRLILNEGIKKQGAEAPFRVGAAVSCFYLNAYVT